MQLILKLLLKERVWLGIVILASIITALFILVQSFAIATILDSSISQATQQSLNQSEIKTKTEDLTPSETILSNFNDETFYQSIINLYKHYQIHGKKKTLETIVNLENYFLLGIIGIAIIIILFLFQLFSYIRDLAIKYLGIKVSLAIRTNFFNQLINKPASFHLEQKSSQLTSNLLNDINNLQFSLQGFLGSIITSPIIVIIGTITLFFINVPLTIGVFLSLLVLVFIVNILSKLLKKEVFKAQSKIADLTLYIQQTLRAIEILKIFNRERKEKQLFKQTVSDYRKASFNEQSILCLNRPLNELFGAMTVFGLLFYGTFLLSREYIVLTDIFEFIVLLQFVAPFAQKISNAFLLKNQLDVYVTRLDSALKEDSQVKTKIKKEYLESIYHYNGNIQVKNINYQYPKSKDVSIKNVSCKINAGEFVAIVGSSGSGKTTFIRLIMQVLQPKTGEILYDGKSFESINNGQLRKHIGYVSQESILFSGSVRDNIIYSKPNATENQIWEALKQANIDDFVMSLSKKLETNIGEFGSQLSGGQKQRLCIARALLRKPKILILDEATSALDAVSENSIKKTINNIKGNLTVVVIAHRLSTIINSDQILVFDQGEIIQKGTHESLSKEKGLYSEFVNHQLN